MVSVQQIQNGIAQFITDEISSGMQGFQKIIFETGAGLYIGKLPHTISVYAENPMLKPLNIIQPDGKVDIDTLYDEMKKHFTKPVSFTAPILGTVTMTQTDLDKIYGLITTTGGAKQ